MLVIFDCDGVLVDSESLASVVFSEVLATKGIAFSPTDCYRQFHGHSMAYCYAWLEENFNVLLPEDFGEQLALATQKRFAMDLKSVQGVGDVLVWLQERNIAFCVASNGAHKKINHSLSVTGLDHFFSDFPANTVRRFSVEDVEHGKPAPDLFLHAADAVGVPPSFCVVVEDSASGFAAAEAAGMRLIKYLPDASPQAQEEDSRICLSMLEVLDTLQKGI